MSEIKSIAIDLAKTVFQLHGVDDRGVTVLVKRVSRNRLLATLARIPPCTVVMEACMSAHYWGRQIGALGHLVRLIPPQYVKPYVLGNKTDANDCVAILEAMRRPKLHFVSVKSEEQQSLLAAHRFRSLLVKRRTALLNHIRSELLEFGICLPAGISKLRSALNDPQIRAALPPLMKEIAAQMHEEVRAADAALDEATARIEHLARAHRTCRYLMRRPGIGVHTASALVAEIEPTQFKNGRQLSASIGLVPREHASGNKQVRLGITKRGNSTLRTLLIHGARSVVRTIHTRNDPLGQWVQALIARRGKHKAIVALANKMARYAWVDLIQARQLA